MPSYAHGVGAERIHVLTSLSSMTSPSLAEINAGVDLSGFLLKDGFSRPRSGNEVNVSVVTNRENLSVAGSINNGPITMKFRLDDTTDTAWNTLVEGSAKYVVFLPTGGSGTGGAIGVGDVVEVHHGDILERAKEDIAENARAAFSARLSTRTPPVLAAVVVA